MTDPIAVDVPAKPSYSRSVPPGAPTVPAVPSPTPASTTPSPTPAPAPTAKVEAPKIEAPKAEVPKPSPSAIVPAVTVAAAAAGAPPVALAPTAASLLERFSKKQLIIGATAALSLFAGVAAVRMLFPAKATPPTAQTTAANDKALPPAPTPPPAPAPEKPALKAPAVHPEPTNFDPIIPPPLPTTPVTTTRPNEIQPVTHNPVPPVMPDPRFAAPPTGIPVVSPTPAPPMITPDPRYPATPSPIPGPDSRVGWPAPVPAPKLPDATFTPIPAPGGVAPKPPEPAVSPIPAPGGVMPSPSSSPTQPNVFPVPSDLAPKNDIKPVPQPEVKPPQPDLKLIPLPDAKPPAAFDPPPPTGFTKPAGASEAKPAAPVFAPKTTFDVDVYEPKLEDTYETISQEFYNDRRFASALKAFNANKPLQGGAYINVPPMHVLKRQTPNAGGVTPIGGASSAPEWGAAPTTRPAARRGTFVVPQGGMTLEEIARQTMGSQQRWRDLYDLNPQITNTAAVVPGGTELKLPPDARTP